VQFGQVCGVCVVWMCFLCDEGWFPCALQESQCQWFCSVPRLNTVLQKGQCMLLRKQKDSWRSIVREGIHWVQFLQRWWSALGGSDERAPVFKGEMSVCVMKSV